MTDTHAERLAYTVPEALKLVPMSRNAFYAAVRAGDIPSTKIRGKILIPRVPFDRMFNGSAA